MKRTASRSNMMIAPTLLIVLGIILWACSGPENSTAAGSEPVHSCQILTPQEIEQLVDAAVDQPPRETHRENREMNHWMSMCSYYAPGRALSIGIQIQPAPASRKSPPETALSEYLKNLQEDLPDLEFELIDTVGQPAAWDAASSQLTVFNETHMLIVSAMSRELSAQQRQELTVALAREVLVRGDS